MGGGGDANLFHQYCTITAGGGEPLATLGTWALGMRELVRFDPGPQPGSRKPRTFYELLGDVRVASPRLCDLGRTIGDLGRTTGRMRGFSARFPRTGHELDSHSKKIRCSRAAPTLDHTLAALLKANPTSLAASNTVPRVSRPN